MVQELGPEYFCLDFWPRQSLDKWEMAFGNPLG